MIPSALPASVPAQAPAAVLARARRATRLQFAVLGGCAGVWGAHIPSVKARYGLDEAALALVLLTAAAGAVSALLFAGRTVGRLGARGATVAAGVVLCVALALVLQLPNLVALLLVAFVLGAGSSLFDVAINTEGSELEQRGGRALMSNLHAMFSVGGMAGAALVALLLRHGVAAPLQTAAVAVLLAACIVAGSRGMLRTHGGGGVGEGLQFVWPRGLLLVIGLLVGLGMVAEGVMYDWSVLYLQQELGVAQAQAALGYAAFAGAMALARFAGDSLRERFSEPALLCGGGVLAALSMAVVLLAASPTVAFVGFVLVGAGLAPVAPILYGAATRVPGVSRAAAIAAATSLGYGGFMLGPPLIGALAHARSLTAALGVVVLATALLALGARWVPPRR